MSVDSDYPRTPIVKFGNGWAPAIMSQTSIRPAHPDETWLEALRRVAEPPELLPERTHPSTESPTA